MTEEEFMELYSALSDQNKVILIIEMDRLLTEQNQANRSE